MDRVMQQERVRQRVGEGIIDQVAVMALNDRRCR
jgi:hypothetical protein